MRLALASVALAGAAIVLGGCYYYPPEAYGPPPGGAYGPPPGYNEQGPPPQGEYGPPPGNEGQGAPPPQGGYGPPPSQGQGYGPPPGGEGYESMSGGAASMAPAPPPGYSAEWCAAHPHKCRRLQKRAARAAGQYGPPPGEGQEYGPPPGEND